MNEQDDDTPITLAEAAQRMFPPGTMTEGGLKRLVRSGKLQAYKPGKQYLTTRADIRRMLEATRVKKRT